MDKSNKITKATLERPRKRPRSTMWPTIENSQEHKFSAIVKKLTSSVEIGYGLVMDFL